MKYFIIFFVIVLSFSVISVYAIPVLYTIEDLEKLSKYTLKGKIIDIKPTLDKNIFSDAQSDAGEISVNVDDESNDQYTNYTIKFRAKYYTSIWPLPKSAEPHKAFEVGQSVSVFLMEKMPDSENSYAGFIADGYLVSEGTAYDVTSTKQVSPLKQHQSGTLSRSVNCNNGLELLIKATNGQPICVKPSTKEKLIERGWYYPVPFGKGLQAEQQTNSSQINSCKKDNELFYDACVMEIESADPNQVLDEFDGVIIDNSLGTGHRYAFLTNDPFRTFNTGSLGIRLEGIDDTDNLHGKHVMISGTIEKNGEDRIKVYKIQVLDSLIPKGNSFSKDIIDVSFDDLTKNPDKYYDQMIRITGKLREYDDPLAHAGVGCDVARYVTSDEFIPDFASRRHLYDGERKIGVRIGGHDDVGYSESEKLPPGIKNKQVSIVGMLVPNLKSAGACNHVLYKSGYILTDFDKIEAK